MYRSYFLATTTKDDEMRIHLGANSRPISFEYYTENQNTQQTTSATYYYHYDLHGNVIRVTNSSGTTVIQYTYDQLGSIVSETNSSSIYNPFTYMGEAQVIHDDEFDTSGSTPKTGLYSSGSGYYNPHTGTFLGGSGAPASANPTSTSAEEPTAQSTRPAGQLGAHAAISSTAGGVPSSAGCASSTDVSPADPFQGINLCGELYTPADGSEDPMKWLACADMPEKDIWGMNRMEEEAERVREYFAKLNAKQEEERRYKKEFDRYWNLTEEEREAERKWREEQNRGKFIVPDLTPEGRARARIDYWDEIPDRIQGLIIENYKNNHGDKRSDEEIKKFLAENLVWAAWGDMKEDQEYTMPGGSVTLKVKAGLYLMGYQLKGELPHLFWGPGQMAWSHAKSDARTSTENLIGEEFSDSTETEAGDGYRDTATQWARSWNMCGGNTIMGGITLNCRILDPDIDKIVLGVTGAHKGDNQTDRITVSLSQGSVNMHEFAYGAGKATGLYPGGNFANIMIVIYVKKMEINLHGDLTLDLVVETILKMKI